MSCLQCACLLLVLCLPAVAKEPGAPRSRPARAAFLRAHPCPANGAPRGSCPGFVVDHVIPLRCGGPDAPANMQWQTVTQAKRKDVLERDCRNFPAR
jgi:hypothetical protein